MVSPQAVISWLRSSLAGAKCFESFATSAFVREGERERKSETKREEGSGRAGQRARARAGHQFDDLKIA